MAYNGSHRYKEREHKEIVKGKKGFQALDWASEEYLESALRRFLAKCEFDPFTGCVNWIGGKTKGRGKTRDYGTFWFAGKRWSAHRWAAKYIHGFNIDDLDVDHECCNTLCQRHLQPLPGDVNSAYYWIRLEKGVFGDPEQANERESAQRASDDAIPFHEPPDWLPKPSQDASCPF